MVNVWVDDERTPPEGWMWVETVKDAIGLLELRRIENLSLDYTLHKGETTDAIMDWLREHPERWPTGSIVCHSSSAAAVELIERMIKDFAPMAG